MKWLYKVDIFILYYAIDANLLTFSFTGVDPYVESEVKEFDQRVVQWMIAEKVC